MVRPTLKGAEPVNGRRLPLPERAGPALRYLGIGLLAMAVGSATLTFDWIISHRVDVNLVAEFAGSVIYPSDIFLVGGLATWVFGWFLSPDKTLRTGPWYTFLPMLALTVMSVASIIWAVDGPQTAFSALRRSCLFGRYIVMATEFSKALAPALAALFVFGVLHAVVGLGQVVAGASLGLSMLGEVTSTYYLDVFIGDSRAYGLGFNPNPIGLFLAVVIVSAFGLFVLKRVHGPVAILALAVFGVCLLGLMATQSRAAMVGGLLGGLTVAISVFGGSPEFRWSALRRVGIIAAFVVLTLGTLGAGAAILGALNGPGEPAPRFTLVSQIAQRIGSEDVSRGLQSRTKDWDLAYPVIRDNVALGVGAGNFPTALKNRLNPDTPDGLWVPIHNVFLLNLAELGVLGAASWLVIMAAPMLWLLTLKKRTLPRSEAWVWLGPLIVLLTVSLVEFSPWATQDARLLFPAVLGLWAGAVSYRFDATILP